MRNEKSECVGRIQKMFAVMPDASLVGSRLWESGEIAKGEMIKILIMITSTFTASGRERLPFLRGRVS